jgi:hypothetical protein
MSNVGDTGNGTSAKPSPACANAALHCHDVDILRCQSNRNANATTPSIIGGKYTMMLSVSMGGNNPKHYSWLQCLPTVAKLKFIEVIDDKENFQPIVLFFSLPLS